MRILKLGVERELARAERGKRIHCLVAVVALDRVSAARPPQQLHLVIHCKPDPINSDHFSRQFDFY
jgi:hypothetical protein